MKMGASSGVVLALAAALTLSACGSSSNTSATNAAVSTTTQSTSSTTSTSTTSHKPKAHKKTTQHKTTTTTTSKTTTSKKTTSTTTTTSKTTTTHTTTSKTTTTTAAFKGPLQATLTGENHYPKIGVKWAYTVTAKDANGKPLSGTIETEFWFGGAKVGQESPLKHTFTNGTITNKVTFPARANNVTGLQLQVTVITSVGTKTLDWTVNPTTK
jgi:hypothetical protein